MTKINSGLQLNLCTLQGALCLNNPDTSWYIFETVNALKSREHIIKIPLTELVISIKIAPFRGKIIQDQTIRFEVQENATMCIHNKVDMLSKSCIKLEGIKEQKQEQPKKWTGVQKAASRLGYAL